jgi:DNA-binding CsgD family transcriptional regulator
VRLLERDHPLELLGERARRAAEGHGNLVLVAGEAGIGKTVLLRSFAASLREPPLWGMCDALTTPRPLGPLRDVAGELGDPIPALLRDAAPQHEIFAAVHDALRARPRTLIIEDLHWADEATTDLVRFLARRIATTPSLMVVSYRDPSEKPLGPVLGDLVTAPDTRRLQLTPLSVDAVAALLDGQGPDPADVHRRTGGNPFFVSQIAAQPTSPIPDSVRDAVLARAAALATPARRALELLSCAPKRVGGELLAALGIATDAVEALAATGLMDRSGTGIAFRHEIARSAVLGATAPGVEPSLHTAMIEALESIGGDAAVLAHHAVAAGDVARIRRYAPAAAGEAARSGAHREAVAFYELALAQPGLDTADRAGLLEGLSDELYFTERLDSALAVRAEALELRRALADEIGVGTAHRVMSGFAWYAADSAAAVRHEGAAIEILGRSGDRREYAYALSNSAYLAAHRGETDLALDAGLRAQEIASELDADSLLRGAAGIGVGLARLLTGDPAGRQELFRARDAGLQHGRDELATGAMSNLAHMDLEQGRWREAEDVLNEAIPFSAERDITICSMWQRGMRGRLRLLQGRWAEAEADARGVLATGELPLGRFWAHLVLGLLAARGAVSRAASSGPAGGSASAENPHLDELWALAERLDQVDKWMIAAGALAEQAWITRTPDPRLDDPRLDGLVGLDLPGREHTAVSFRWWMWRLDAAGVQKVGLPDQPAPLPRHGEQPYEDALACVDSGVPENLLLALPRLDELGARAVSALVRGQLREAGVTGIPRGASAATRENPLGLTARQLDVLALLAEGLTNAEIAARLVISPKTADHHVSAILGKLDVRSRGEAAAAARKLGL